MWDLRKLPQGGAQRVHPGPQPTPSLPRRRSQQCLPPSLWLLRQRVSVSLGRRGWGPIWPEVEMGAPIVEGAEGISPSCSSSLPRDI